MPLRQIGLLMFLFLLAMAGCVPDSLGNQSSGRPTKWVIVDQRAPGVSAMTNEQAQAYVGRAISFGTKEARSGSDLCTSPTYEAGAKAAAKLLPLDYKIRPVDLDLDEDAKLDVMRVYCDDQPWTTIGSVVLWDAIDHGFAVFDGVFFELEPSSQLK